jgi:hypothetical protein
MAGKKAWGVQNLSSTDPNAYEWGSGKEELLGIRFTIPAVAGSTLVMNSRNSLLNIHEVYTITLSIAMGGFAIDQHNLTESLEVTAWI